MRTTKTAPTRNSRLTRPAAGWLLLGTLALGFTLGLAGCQAPLDVTTYCQRSTDANVAVMKRCGFLDDAQAELTKKKFLAQCNAMLASQSGPSWAFSLDLAQGCLDQLASHECFAWVEHCQTAHLSDKFGFQSCNTYIDVHSFPADCSPFVHGTAPELAGTACDKRMGCGSLACTGPDLTCGVCTAPVSPPLPCGPCDATSYCDTQTKTCQPKKAAHAACLSSAECLDRPCTGNTCDYVALGATCVYNPDCGPAAYCRGLRWSSQAVPVTPGVCAARILTGGACVDEQLDDGCAEMNASCGNGICRVVPAHSLQAGAVCDAQVQCADPLLCAGLGSALGGTGICGPTDLGSAGQPCGQGRACRYLLSCDGTGTCQPDSVALLNQDCTNGGSTCIEGLCQLSGPGNPALCLPLIEDGGVCTPDRGGCLHGRCVPDCLSNCSSSIYHCAPPC